jgi:hypothetical protein
MFSLHAVAETVLVCLIHRRHVFRRGEMLGRWLGSFRLIAMAVLGCW